MRDTKPVVTDSQEASKNFTHPSEAALSSKPKQVISELRMEENHGKTGRHVEKEHSGNRRPCSNPTGHCLTHCKIKLGSQCALRVHGSSTVTTWRSFFKLFSLKRFFFFPVPFTDGTVSFTKPLYEGMRNLQNVQEGF